MSKKSNTTNTPSNSQLRTFLHRGDVLLAIGLATIVTVLGIVGQSWLGPTGFVLTIGVAIGLVFAVLLETYRRLQRHIQVVMQLCQQFEGLISFYSSIRPEQPLPPLRGYAIAPDLLHVLTMTVLEERPTVVLECGSGTSTISMAYCLKRLRRGKVIALEHEKEFASAMGKRLETHGLTEWAEVVHAPLRPLDEKRDSRLWYETSLLERIGTIDLLFVDGPPGYLGKMMRAPALGVLYSRLSEVAVVIVDDANRQDEKQMVENWLREFPDFDCEWLETSKGTAVLRRRMKGPADQDG